MKDPEHYQLLNFKELNKVTEGRNGAKSHHDEDTATVKEDQTVRY